MHFKYVFLKIATGFKTGFIRNSFVFLKIINEHHRPSFFMRAVGKGIKAKEHKTEQVSK